MRVRQDIPGQAPLYLAAVQCEHPECRDVVIGGVLDASGHCAACAQPREVACADCDVMTREDVLERGMCPVCVADAYERDEQAAEE